MPKYPEEVVKRIKLLDLYRVNDELEQFDIFHLYPGRIAYPDGYYDSRFFNLVGFNTHKTEKRILGDRDAVDFTLCQVGCVVDGVQVYADGSFFIKLKHMVRIESDTQRIHFVRSSLT